MARSRALVLLVPFLALAATAAFAQPIVLSGSITDRDGKPIPGARAQVFARESDYQAARRWWMGGPEPPALAEAAADAAGRYRIDLADGGFYVLRATAPGHLSRQRTLTPVLDDTELEAAKLEPSSDVAVHVEGPDRRPRASAWVGAAPTTVGASADDPWIPAPRRCRTGADGVCKLPRGQGEKPRWLAAASGSMEVAAAPGQTTIGLGSAKARPLRLVDARRQPVAEVYALAGDGDWPLAVSSASGELEVPDIRGSVRLVSREGPAWERPLPAASPSGERVTIELPAAGAIEGRVLDLTTRLPIAGAWVWASQSLQNPARTRADGTYLLSALAPGGASVRAAARGYLAGFGAVAAPVSGSTTRGPAVALYPAARLRGLVVDSSGRAVAGVAVVASFDRQRASRELTALGFWPRPSRARSDVSGRFLLPALGRGMAYLLEAQASAFAPAEARVTPGENDAEVRIVLVAGTTAHGVSVDQERQPVAGARAELRPDPGQTEMFAIFDPQVRPNAATSDSSGRFEFSHLAAGRYALSVAAPGYAPVEVPGLEVAEGESRRDLGTVILLPEAVIEGTVVDEAGKPVAGASVSVGNADATSRMQALVGDEGSPRTESAADGFFRVGGLRLKTPVDLIVAAAGFSDTRTAGVGPWAPGEAAAAPIRIVLHPASRLTARVVDRDGHPVAGADVFYGIERRSPEASVVRGGRNDPIKTDDDGRFELRDLPEGLVRVTVRADGYRTSELDAPVAPGKDALDLELVLLPGAVIVGRVTQASDAPVMGAQVRVDEGRRGGAVTRTDADGAYRLEGVEPGRRSLRASDARGRQATKEVEVGRSETTVDIVLPSGASVSGLVVDAEGLPVAGANVFLRGGGSYGIRDSNPTVADGSFTISDVAAGEYSLLVRRDGYASAEQKLVVTGPPVAGIEVRLVRGTTLAGQLEGLKFPELPRAEIQAFRPGAWDYVQGSADYAGRFRLQGLAPGDWQVAAMIEPGGRQAHTQVTIAPGDVEIPVVLHFEDGLVLSGVVRRRGEPVGGADVVLEGKDVSGGAITTSTANGGFKAEGLSPGTYELTVHTGGGGIAYRRTLAVTENVEVAVDLLGAKLSGRVIDAATGEPIARARVQILPADGEPSWQFGPQDAQTDSRGAFFLDDLAAGRWRLRGQATGYALAERAIAIAEEAGSIEVEVALQATEGVVLQVTLAGRPVTVGSAVVLDAAGRWIWGGSFSVADNGRARLESVPPGAYTAWVMTYDSAPAATAIAVPGPVVPVALEPGARVTVRVPDLAQDAALAKVSLVDAGGQLLRLPRSQDLESEFDMRSGRAMVRGVHAGPWTITARTGDGRTWTGTAVIPPGGGEVEVELEKR